MNPKDQFVIRIRVDARQGTPADGIAIDGDILAVLRVAKALSGHVDDEIKLAQESGLQIHRVD